MAAVHGIVSLSGASARTTVTPDAVQEMVLALSDTRLGPARIREWHQDTIDLCVAGQLEPADTGDVETLVERPDGSIWLADLKLHARDALLPTLPESDGRRPDLALLITAWETYGDQVFDRLVAEGVVVHIEPRRQRVRCWRDPLGVRPLYLHHRPGRLVFSSDLRSLVAHPEIDGRIDLGFARSQLQSYEFQDRRRTCVVGVDKLPSGYLATIDRQGIRLSRHWDPARLTTSSSGRVEDLAEEVRTTVTSAVRERIDGQAGPVGVHLSGGLDSSSLATLAARIRADVHGFSWAPSPSAEPLLDRDERSLAIDVAQAASVPLHFTTLTPAGLADVAYRDAALRPVAALNIEAQTSRGAVDQGVRVMLSGWGGDEAIAFNGRGHFADLARRGRLRHVQRELRERQALHGGSLTRMWLARVALPHLPDPLHARARSGRPPAVAELPRELRPAFARELLEFDHISRPSPRERPGVTRMQLALLEFGHLQARLESWASHGFDIGLRYSFPLLDRRVVELALRLPQELHFRDGWKRWIYRTAMEGVLPDSVRWNTTKFDSAAEVQLTRVLRAPSPAYRERLELGRGSPLADVDLVIDKQRRYQRYAVERDPSLLHPDDDLIGGGVWWAFSGLRP